MHAESVTFGMPFGVDPACSYKFAEIITFVAFPIGEFVIVLIGIGDVFSKDIPESGDTFSKRNAGRGDRFGTR
jgi:hypothetical protein